jgi:hypothetical protein
VAGPWSDAVPARRDREGAVGAPELAGVLDLEAGIPQPLLGLGVIVRDHGRVAQDRRRVALGQDQMDLCRVALEPADGVAEHIGRRDLLEAEQAPELSRAIRLLRRNFERDVMEHA